LSVLDELRDIGDMDIDPSVSLSSCPVFAVLALESDDLHTPATLLLFSNSQLLASEDIFRESEERKCDTSSSRQATWVLKIELSIRRTMQFMLRRTLFCADKLRRKTMPKKASGNFLTLKKLVQQFVKKNVHPRAPRQLNHGQQDKESEHRFWSDRYMYRSEGEKEEPIFTCSAQQQACSRNFFTSPSKAARSRSHICRCTIICSWCSSSVCNSISCDTV
jgi:hypothetical protein